MMTTPEKIVEKMLVSDTFSKWMGLKVEEVGTGTCTLSMTVREDMLNGVGTLHGGVIFSAADSAFAFACNSHGRVTVALTVSISFYEAGKLGDVLTITAQETHLGNKTAHYNIEVFNQNGKNIATFKGTAYRTHLEHEIAI
jgi:acyl-CoA thioesterase